MSSRRPLASAVLAVLAACSSGGSNGGGGGNPVPAAYQGIWLGDCNDRHDGTSDISRVVVGPTTATETRTQYSASNVCAGNGTELAPTSGSLNNVGTVMVSLGATTVSAIQIDATFGATTDYGLVYVDTTVTPNRMYSGLNDPAHDGSTPAHRPVALDESSYTLKLNPLPAAYQGTWLAPCNDHHDGTSARERLVVGATTFTMTAVDYGAASDCTGASTPGGSMNGSLNNAGTVTANLGATPVTALKLDVVPNTGSIVYMLFYADTTVNPNRLYGGDDDPAHDGSTPATRPVQLDASSYDQKQ